jgi:hypothetical protein
MNFCVAVIERQRQLFFFCSFIGQNMDHKSQAQVTLWIHISSLLKIDIEERKNTAHRPPLHFAPTHGDGHKNEQTCL